MQVFERRPGDAFALIATIDTTNRFPQMLRCDRELIAWNTDGNQLLYSLPPFIDATSIATIADRPPFRVQFPNVRSGRCWLVCWSRCWALTLIERLAIDHLQALWPLGTQCHDTILERALETRVCEHHRHWRQPLQHVVGLSRDRDATERQASSSYRTRHLLFSTFDCESINESNSLRISHLREWMRFVDCRDEHTSFLMECCSLLDAGCCCTTSRASIQRFHSTRTKWLSCNSA